MSGSALATKGLGKRFGSQWALRDCNVHVPSGRVSALLGSNGAGKSTFLRLCTGLATPTSGSVEVLGRAPGSGEEFLASIGYLAQDVPLYRRLSARDHLDLGSHVNRSWDADGARDRLARLQIAMDRPVETLSGGQRAQVGLSLALAKRPDILLLDEPVASLDPLARREFLATLSGAVAEGGLSVVISSHLVHDLERVCDHLILLSASRVLLCEDIDTLLETHRVLVGPRRDLRSLAPSATVVRATETRRQVRVLVRVHSPMLDPSWEVSEVTLEDLVLAYMERERATSPAPFGIVEMAS